jgi:hypothetical protein
MGNVRREIWHFRKDSLNTLNHSVMLVVYAVEQEGKIAPRDLCLNQRVVGSLSASLFLNSRLEMPEG